MQKRVFLDLRGLAEPIHRLAEQAGNPLAPTVRQLLAEAIAARAQRGDVL